MSELYNTLELYFLADMHREDPLHLHKLVQKWRDEVLEKENRYVILNGDLVNMACRHAVTDIHEQTLDPDVAIDEVCDFLLPIKDRIIAITEGNHEKRSKKHAGIRVMNRVARELGISRCYAEGAYLIFLSFGKSQGRNCRKMIYSIYGRHGSGGGKKAGAAANKLEDMRGFVDADIYIHSHTHQPFIIPLKFIRVDYRNRKPTFCEKVGVNTNAWMEWGGYAEDGGFGPKSCKYPKLILKGEVRDIGGGFGI